MNTTQAAALIANNMKYLVHLCVKGMKRDDFSQLHVWYEVLLQNYDQIVNLFENESNDPLAISNSLGVIKCGLFSND